MAWSPDGTRIAVTTMTGVVLLGAASLQELASATTDLPQDAVAFSQDGTRLATADFGRERRWFRLWDGRDLSLALQADLPGSSEDRDPVILMTFLPNGDLLLATSSVLGVDIWRMAPDGAMNRALQIQGVIPETTAIEPSQGLVAASMGPGGPEQTVQIWDMATGALRQELPYSGVIELEFAAEPGVLLVSGDSLFAWDIVQGREIAVAQTLVGAGTGPGLPGRITVGDADTLFATGTEIPSPGIGLWEVTTGGLVGLIAIEDASRIGWFSLSPTSSEIGMLLDSGRLQIWEVAR